MDHLKYPIGKFEFGKTYSASDNLKHIGIIEKFPAELNALTKQLIEAHLAKSYRPGGWSARQIIHHLADSHINAYVRVKLTLTENKPVIKPYDQDSWAALPDNSLPVDVSVKLIEGIHQRWVVLLRAMKNEDFQRKYIHPEYQREFALDEFIALYAWHGAQHAAHLKLIIGH